MDNFLDAIDDGYCRVYEDLGIFIVWNGSVTFNVYSDFDARAVDAFTIHDVQDMSEARHYMDEHADMYRTDQDW